MTPNPRHPGNTRIIRFRKQDRGAALFVALMLLIILSLLAVSASQVVVLQERMSAAYWSDMSIFEVSEANLKLTESRIRADVQSVCGIKASSTNPVDGWAGGGLPPGESSAATVENLQRGDAARGSGLAGSLRAGRAIPAGVQCSHFRVSVANVDDADNPTTRSILQTTFIP